LEISLPEEVLLEEEEVLVALAEVPLVAVVLVAVGKN
jgi:hypothetical protein